MGKRDSLFPVVNLYSFEQHYTLVARNEALPYSITPQLQHLLVTYSGSEHDYIHECHSGSDDDKSNHLNGDARGSAPGHELRISGFDTGIVALLDHVAIMNWEDPNSVLALEVQALKRVKEGPAVHHWVLCHWC